MHGMPSGYQWMPAGIRNRLAWAATLVALVGGLVVAAQPASAAPPAPYWASTQATIATITLNWSISDSTGVTKFQYQQKASGGSWSAWTDILGSGAGTTSFTKTGLTPGTSYQFKLRAVAGITPGATSTTRSKSTDYVPSAALLRSQIVKTSTSITLKWRSDSSNEITKWEVRYKLSSAGSYGSWTNVGGAATRTHTVSGLTAGADYTFQLRAVVGSTPGSAQTYTASTTAAGGTPTPTPRVTTTPPAPAWSSSQATSTTITLNWSIGSNAGVTRYQYQQKTGSGSWSAWTNMPGSGAGTTSFTRTGLTPATSYSFKLRAVAGSAMGTASTHQTTTTAEVPSPAFLPNQFVSTSASITLKWNSASNNEITKWEVRYKLSSAGSYGSWTNVGGAATRTHRASGLTGGKEYDFQLRAVVGSTAGSSQTIQAATLPPAPTWVSSPATATTITLNWSIGGDTGVTKYQYQQKAGGSSWSVWSDIPGSGAGSTSFSRTGLTPATSYSFRLRAVAEGDAAGAASASRTQATNGVPAPSWLQSQFVSTQTSITLKWSSPSNNEITRWEVRYKLSSAGSYGNWTNAGGAATRTHRVSGLTAGTQYAFQLRAVIGSTPGSAQTTQTSTSTAAGQTPTVTNTPTVRRTGPVTATLQPCRLTQAGPGNAPAAVSCARTIPGTGAISVVRASGKTGVLASGGPSISARTVTFAPSTAVDGDADVGAATWHIVATSGDGIELARYAITLTTYAVGQTPAAGSPAIEIRFVSDSDGVVPPDVNVIVKVDAKHGAVVDRVAMQSLGFFAKRTEYIPDNYLDRNRDNVVDASDHDDDTNPDVRIHRVSLGSYFEAEQTLLFAQLANPTRVQGVYYPHQVLDNRCERVNYSDGSTFLPPDCGSATLTLGQTSGHIGTSGFELEIAVPPATAAGEYVMTVWGRRSYTDDTPIIVSKTLTVSASANRLATVSLGLNAPSRTGAVYVDARQGDGEPTTDSSAIAAGTSRTELTAIAAGSGTTELTLAVLNENNMPSQASAVTSIVITTTAGTLSTPQITNSAGAKIDQKANCKNQGAVVCELDLTSLKANGSPMPAKIHLLLTAPSTPGTATITAAVIADGKVFTPTPVQVRFTGPLASMRVGAGTGTVLGYDVGNDEKANYNASTMPDRGADARDQIAFRVDALDATGTVVDTPTLSVNLKNPDGNLVSQSKYETTQTGDLMHTLTLDIDAPQAEALPAGLYTLEVRSGQMSASMTFTVATATANLSVTLNPDHPSRIGQEVIARAIATDAAGNPVADGTTVNFGVWDLVGDGDSVAILDTESALTMGGAASVTLTVVGPGRAVLRATVSDNTTSARAVAVLTSTAGAPGSPTEPGDQTSDEASLDCLSALSGFSTWSCDETTASEIFGLLSARGATALHLWVGSSWARYAAAGGTMLPGSTDFRIAANDVLYINN